MEEKNKETVEKEKPAEAEKAVENVVETAPVEAPIAEAITPAAPTVEITPEDVKAFMPSLENWKPKTKLGKEVMEGKQDNIYKILENGVKIKEFQIVDKLVPDLGNEIIYIGGSPGKGGGSQRTITKKTARMHKSGRRFRLSSLVVVGNGNGIVGIGQGTGKEHRNAIEKAVEHAKLNLVTIRRGCGSWQCACGQAHSFATKAVGRSGSVTVEFRPAPRGTGLVTSDDLKKVLKSVGIKDAWCRTSGNTASRTNLIKAGFNALKSMNNMKTVSNDLFLKGQSKENEKVQSNKLSSEESLIKEALEKGKSNKPLEKA
ncbi:MAG: 30S ribosomal protein S5 [Candidatus Aenigmatarchaeota archaeon]